MAASPEPSGKSQILETGSSDFPNLTLAIFKMHYDKQKPALVKHILRKHFSYSEFFWSLPFPIWTEYGEIFCISPCTVQMRGNTDQKKSEYRDLLRKYKDYKNFLNEMF